MLHIWAQRTGSSKKEICIISSASRPEMGRQAALRQLYTRARALRFSLTMRMASLSFSTVIALPVNSSTFRANAAISSFHLRMSFSRFIWGTSMMYMGTSSPRIS